MCACVLYLSISFSIIVLVKADTIENYNGNRNIMKPPMVLNKKNNWSKLNGTYIETSDNYVRLPVMKPANEFMKMKFKKSPRRTIQKIIKKNRLKSRKLYLSQVTSQTTLSPNKEYDFYAQEDNQRQEEVTTQGNQKRRIKKYNNYPRNPPSLFNHWGNHKKTKREVDRNDVYILTDFDEMKFLGHGKDYDVVSTHFRDHW